MKHSDRAVFALAVLAMMWPMTAAFAGGEITGGSWKVTEIAGRPAASNAGMLRFEKHRVTGKAACNRFFASLNTGAAGSRLELGPIGATRMHCEGSMETEQALLDALASVRTYRVDANVLRLQDAEGKPLVTLSR